MPTSKTDNDQTGERPLGAHPSPGTTGVTPRGGAA
jgi:hypothetical protein